MPLVCFRGQVSIKLLLQAASHILETCYDAARQVGLKVDGREGEVRAGSVSITPSLAMIRSTFKATGLSPASSSSLTTHSIPLSANSGYRAGGSTLPGKASDLLMERACRLLLDQDSESGHLTIRGTYFKRKNNYKTKPTKSCFAPCAASYQPRTVWMVSMTSPSPPWGKSSKIRFSSSNAAETSS